ncbi:MAG: acetate--CoA ligase family protein [Promethearchaeota archaeon]
MTDLSYFFEPKSIAIIGASDKLRFGYATTNYLLNSDFKTYPVHIKKDEILGHKAYKNVKDIPDQIELAIIMVPNKEVLQAIKDCVEKGVKGIIIESAGFAETGIDKLIKIQEEIVNLIKKSNVRIIGPNCIGVSNFTNRFTTADVNFDRIMKGGISIIAQSGVLGNMFLDWGGSQKIGFAKVITLGNKIDVDEVDMLEYLNNDSETKVITLYLEGTKRGKDLIEILRRMKKPVIILKNGRSQSGIRAAMSHTGSIAGNDKIYEAVFRQFPAVFRVNNFYEMFNIAHTFSTQPLPKGKEIAIITGSGSLGILACDLLEKYGLHLANLSGDTIQKIKSVIPEWVSIEATIDLGPSMFKTLIPTVKAIMNDRNVDCLLYIYAIPRWPLEMFNINLSPYFRLIKKLSKYLNKPCICVAFGSRWVFEYVQKAANKENSRYRIPIMTRLKHAVKAFKMMIEFGEYLERKGLK